jgi:hypothetical protein
MAIAHALKAVAIGDQQLHLWLASSDQSEVRLGAKVHKVVSEASTFGHRSVDEGQARAHRAEQGRSRTLALSPSSRAVASGGEGKSPCTFGTDLSKRRKSTIEVLVW